MDGEGLEPSRITPYAPKAYASTNSAIRPFYLFWNGRTNMGHVRLELTTLRLRGVCSTNWANGPDSLLYHIKRDKRKVYDGAL